MTEKSHLVLKNIVNHLLICPYVLTTIDAKALSLAADSCRFTISGAYAEMGDVLTGKL
jgi:hypothetical protein